MFSDRECNLVYAELRAMKHKHLSAKPLLIFDPLLTLVMAMISPFSVNTFAISNWLVACPLNNTMTIN